MKTLELYKKFPVPGARKITDGANSGEQFFEELLSPEFKKAIDSGESLRVVLDGTNGIAGCFINEAFRLLTLKFGKDTVKNNIEIISIEVPRYKILAEETIDKTETIIK